MREHLAAPLALMLAACGGDSYRLFQSTSTPLGNLVRVEEQTRIDLKGEPEGSLAAEAGGTLRLLWFEGQDQIHFDPSLPDFSLVDASGQEHPLVYAGSPTASGALSAADWSFASGGRMSMRGRWAYGGTAQLPEPKLVLVYRLPRGAAKLRLLLPGGEEAIPDP
jgi:hypothetical protein